MDQKVTIEQGYSVNLELGQVHETEAKEGAGEFTHFKLFLFHQRCLHFISIGRHQVTFIDCTLVRF